MKWLILLTLIACGKKEPAAEVYDHDGDGIASPYEAEEKRLFANVQGLQKTEGTIKLKTKGGAKEFEIKFSTDSDLKAEAIKALGYKKIPPELATYFDEFSRAKLEHTIIDADLGPYLTFDLSVQFHSANEDTTLFLVESGQAESLTRKKFGELRGISKERVIALLTGTSYLKFQKEELTQTYQQIMAKTNKVFFYDGKETKILYASKLLGLQDIFRELEIENAREAKELHWNYMDESWWYRDHGSVKVIVWGERIHLKNKFYSLIPSQKSQMERVGGSPQSFLNFTSTEKSKQNLLVRLKPSFPIINDFVTVTKNKDHFANRGEIYESCGWDERYIASQSPKKISLEQLLDELIVRVDGNLVNQQEVLTKVDQSSIADEQEFWELGFEFEGQEISLELKPHSQTDIVGRIKRYNSHRVCDGYNPAYQHQNTEARWQIEADVYQDL